MKYLILVTVLLTGCGPMPQTDAEIRSWNHQMDTLNQMGQQQQNNNQNGYRQFKTTNCYQTVTGYMCNEY